MRWDLIRINNIDKAVSFREEIQGLRAVAVLSVLFFHIWPALLTGGYVGVDVFFVISGYLISKVLIYELRSSGTISLRDFYSRRVCRLVPASTLVIVFIAGFIFLVPKSQWADSAKEILASIFYVQNWWLASHSLDYLAGDDAVGFLRHYWSLSIEEQFYIFFPLLLLFWGFIFKRLRVRSEIIFGCLFSVLIFFSLFYSIYLTGENPGLAYFSTATRIWELAIGGLLAVFVNSRNLFFGIWAGLVGWLGFFAIIGACVFFNSNTVFPGYTALLPTLGTAFVIMAGQSNLRWSNYRLLKLKLLQYIGGISYSLYLWHWPIIVFFGYQINVDLSFFDGTLVFFISLVLAHLTRVFVEIPIIQRRSSYCFGLSFSILIFGFCLILSLLAVGYIWLLSHQASASISKIADSVVDAKGLLSQDYDAGLNTVPSFLNAKKDNSDVYRLQCHVDQFSSEPLTCEFGASTARYHLVLVGDSHAAQWLPSIQELLKDLEEWKITTFTKSACAFNDARLEVGISKEEYKSCTEWNRRVMDEIIEAQPDVIVTSQASSHRAFGSKNEEQSQRILADGLLSKWYSLHKLGSQVLVIRDTPMMDYNPPRCLSSIEGTLHKCATRRIKAFKKDPIMLAMKSNPDVSLLDLSKKICDTDWCWPIQGRVLLWRDRHHLTATYARALSGEFKVILELVK